MARHPSGRTGPLVGGSCARPRACRGYPRARPYALAAATWVRPGRATEPSSATYCARRASIASRRSSRCAGVSAPTARDEARGDVELRVPPVVERRVTEDDRDLLDRDVGEARLLQEGLDAAAGRGRRTCSAPRGRAARSRPSRGAPRSARTPTGSPRGPSMRRARRGRRAAARGASRPAPSRDRRAACSPSARGRRRDRRSEDRSTPRRSCGTRRSSCPAASARARACATISSTASELISRPPGAISSAARKPVSPGPAASSSTRWPGCGSIASTSQCETGSPADWKTSRCVPQAPAARAQCSRLVRRYSEGSSPATSHQIRRNLTTPTFAPPALPNAPDLSTPTALSLYVPLPRLLLDRVAPLAGLAVLLERGEEQHRLLAALGDDAPAWDRRSCTACSCCRPPCSSRASGRSARSPLASPDSPPKTIFVRLRVCRLLAVDGLRRRREPLDLLVVLRLDDPDRRAACRR